MVRSLIHWTGLRSTQPRWLENRTNASRPRGLASKNVFLKDGTNDVAVHEDGPGVAQISTESLSRPWDEDDTTVERVSLNFINP